MNRKQHHGQSGKNLNSQTSRGNFRTDSQRFEHERDSRRFRPSQELNATYNGNSDYNDDYANATSYSHSDSSFEADRPSYSVDAMDHRRPHFNRDSRDPRESRFSRDSKGNHSYAQSEWDHSERPFQASGINSYEYSSKKPMNYSYADESRIPSFEDERYGKGSERMMSTPNRSWDNESYDSSQSSTERGYFGKGPKGYKRTDDRIKEDVCECLSRSSRVDASDIEVSVEDGCVTLSGTVESKIIKRAAEAEIENLSGVDDVRNELKIKKASEMGNSQFGASQGSTLISAKSRSHKATDSL
jgi:osmotically-inducible protein OsmY